MKLISHRGNINGPNTDKENHPSYINLALKDGYHVEIDVWYIDNRILLGHDYGQHQVTIDFLKNKHLWCHAKNLEALEFMLEQDIHCFWHQEDDYTLTSKGIPWVYPGKKVSKNSIWVLPEKTNYKYIKLDCLGICSDNISHYK